LFFNPQQNRHPERSAAQIYHCDTALVARSRRTSAVRILPTLLEAFQPPRLAPGRPATVFPRGAEILWNFVVPPNGMRLFREESRTPLLSTNAALQEIR
jgi:hypothetical protein